jgi:glycosyltransferase involved in cell wall biosynthesis
LNTKISIIVPVYNAEKHLKECLDSIINQTLKEIQIIIINDGSTDNSKEIILDYVAKDKRVTFIDSENEGVSAARNKGIEKSSGRYIGFVDADDYIAPGMYQRLFEIAEENKSAIVICNATHVDEKREFSKRLQLENETFLIRDKAPLILDFLRFKYDSANWNKMYDSNIIKQHHLKFDNRLAIWEDLLFNLKFIVYTDKITTLSEALYYYRVHDSSVIANSKLLLSEQYNLFYESYISFCNKNSFLTEKETFIKERGESCILNLFALLKLRMRMKNKFFTLSNQFGNELKVLNPKIYSESKLFIGINSNLYWLLRYRFFKLFALLYVSHNTIRNRPKYLFKFVRV